MQTGCTWINGISHVQYRVTDKTHISHFHIWEFLASIHTKNEFTEFLRQKLPVAFTHRPIYTNILDLRNDTIFQSSQSVTHHDVLLIRLHYFRDLSISPKWCVTDLASLLRRFIHFSQFCYYANNFNRWSSRKRCLWSTPWISSCDWLWSDWEVYGHAKLSCWQTFLFFPPLLSRLSRLRTRPW